MPSQDDIRAAARRIARHVRRTPILHLSTQDTGFSAPVVLKLEQLQVTGSFKPRGAFNRLLLAGNAAKAGVVAASGGNHGLAVAHAAKMLQLSSEIFVPESTPEAKQRRIRRTGATLTVVGANYDEARQASEARATETGALIVHAYDDEAVIAGQGTVGMEFAADVPDLTHVVVAVGGGGLFGGIASWFDDEVEIIAVEPERCPKLTMALLTGMAMAAPVGGIAADSLGARQIGALPFTIARGRDTRVITVQDDAIRFAQRKLWELARVLAEPGGACAMAALTAGGWAPPPGSKVGVVVCGANCDPGSIES